MNKPRCQQKQSGYIEMYPESVRFAETQMSIVWVPTEYPVQDDLQEFLTVASEADKHAVTTILKLFTKYELMAGNEYWSGRIIRKFPRVDIQRMANAFSFAEINSHAPFYNALNKALHLDTEEFYTSYLDNPILNSRMEHIKEIINHKNDLVSLGAFTLVEGVVLYSAFAFLKHYRNGGKNQFKNVISGINLSVREENLHAQGGAWLYRTLAKELLLSEGELEEITTKILNAAHIIYEHEEKIIEMLFEKGSISGITSKQMQEFVKSRINLCLKELGIEKLYIVTYNPIADWFYDNINAIKFHDFFSTSGSEYHRRWNQDKFIW